MIFFVITNNRNFTASKWNIYLKLSRTIFQFVAKSKICGPVNLWHIKGIYNKRLYDLDSWNTIHHSDNPCMAYKAVTIIAVFVYIICMQ